MAAADPAALFLLAAKEGDKGELARLLKSDPTLLGYRGAGTPDAVVGNTALHWASAKGHAECVDLLLASCADPHARNNGDSSPLHSAAISNHASCARALMRARADPNLADEYGDTPLKLAERANLSDVVAVLRGGDVPAGAASTAAPAPAAGAGVGAAPQSYAMPRRSADEHKESGNACFKAGQYDGAYAHYSAALALSDGAASESGSAETAVAREYSATLLSNRSGALAALARWDEAEADARAAVALRQDWYKGHSRLGAALEGLGRLEEAIVAYESAAAMDGAGEATAQALKRARNAHRAQRLEALLEKSGGSHTDTAPPTSRPSPAPAAAKSPEQIAYAERVARWQGAAKVGDVDTLAELLALFPELLHNRSENTAERLLGNTSLHWSSAFGHQAAALWLLERHADPNGRNCGGSTPLHSAASHARSELLRLLLDRGGDPSVKDVRASAYPLSTRGAYSPFFCPRIPACYPVFYPCSTRDPPALHPRCALVPRYRCAPVSTVPVSLAMYVSLCVSAFCRCPFPSSPHVLSSPFSLPPLSLPAPTMPCARPTPTPRWP
jgi:ankyrin repeat protein